jgi:hypothetical protein
MALDELRSKRVIPILITTDSTSTDQWQILINNVKENNGIVSQVDLSLMESSDLYNPILNAIQQALCNPIETGKMNPHLYSQFCPNSCPNSVPILSYFCPNSCPNL